MSKHHEHWHQNLIRRRAAIVEIVRGLDRAPSPRILQLRLAKRGIRASLAALANDLETLAAAGILPAARPSAPRQPPAPAPSLLLAQGALHASQHSLMHADLCLEVLGHLDPLLSETVVQAQQSLRRAMHALSLGPVPPRTLAVETALDRLIEADRWEHPAEVLERPLPDLSRLLALCDERLSKSRDRESRTRLADVRHKVARTHEGEEIARRRRIERAASALGIEPPRDREPR